MLISIPAVALGAVVGGYIGWKVGKLAFGKKAVTYIAECDFSVVEDDSTNVSNKYMAFYGSHPFK